MKILPTVGRKLYYHPPRNEQGRSTGAYNVLSEDQPLDATILYVHNESSINLMVIDHRGNSRFHEAVKLVQEGEVEPSTGGFCRWMPYQVGQAKKEVS